MAMQTLGLDNYDLTQQSTGSNYKQSSGNFWDYLTLATESFGGAGIETAGWLAGTDSTAYNVTSTAINALYGSSTGMQGISGSSTMPSGLTGYTGSSSYLNGGASTTSNYGHSSSSSSSLDSVQGIIEESAYSQTMLIAMQTELGLQQTTYGAISNAQASNDAMKRSVIQNFRL